jgi:hypothetical protein
LQTERLNQIRSKTPLFLATLLAGLHAGFLCILFSFTVTMLTSDGFYKLTHKFPLCIQDFLRFYSIGQILLSNQREQVYDPNVQLAFFNRLISPAHTDNVMFVQHPPYLFSFFAPFATMPLNLSYAVWLLVSVALGTAVIVLLLSKTGRLSRWQAIAFWIGVSVSLPAWRAHFIGQLSWHLLAIIGLYAWALTSKRDFLAGACLALSTIKVQYLPFLLLPAMAARRSKLLSSFVQAEMLLLCLAGLTVGWSNVFGYPHILLHTESSQDVGLYPEQMVCLRALLSDLPRPLALSLSGTACLLSVGLLFLAWSRLPKVRDVTTPQFRWMLSITVIASIIFAPHVHHYDCLLLTVPAALTLKTVDPFAAAKLPDRLYRCWSQMLIFFPIFGWLVVAACSFSYRFYYLFTTYDAVLLALATLILRKGTASTDLAECA